MAKKEYAKEIEMARRDLRALISSKNCAPINYHASLGVARCRHVRCKNEDRRSKWLDKERNRVQSANSGLKTAIDLCEEVKAKHPRISYADLSLPACWGCCSRRNRRFDYEFVPGRKDSRASPDSATYSILVDDCLGEAMELFQILEKSGYKLNIFTWSNKQRLGVVSYKNAQPRI